MSYPYFFFFLEWNKSIRDKVTFPLELSFCFSLFFKLRNRNGIFSVKTLIFELKCLFQISHWNPPPFFFPAELTLFCLPEKFVFKIPVFLFPHNTFYT